MVDDFIIWLKKQVGSIYVWGGQGETGFNNEWIKDMETNDNNAKRAIAFYDKQKKSGLKNIAAYDCSGLIVRFFIDNGIIKKDITAAGLYGICNKTTKEKLEKGNLLFRYNGSKIHHVGVYIGNQMVIHAKGRDAGVVSEHIDINGEQYWNKFGIVNKLNQRADTKTDLPCLMVYSGKTYVNFRSSASAADSSNIIGKIANGEKVIVLEYLNGGWADVLKIIDDKTYKRGFCISRYFTKERINK